MKYTLKLKLTILYYASRYALYHGSGIVAQDIHGDFGVKNNFSASRRIANSE